MTYEEANNLIDDITWTYKGKSITSEMICECRNKCHDALALQMPKYPILIRQIFSTNPYVMLGIDCPKDDEWFECPKCGETISEGSNYCSACGQAMDWRIYQ